MSTTAPLPPPDSPTAGFPIARPRAQVANPGIDLDWLAARVEYQRFVECIHCGLCTASCPTYIETGNENDSPRGRIYLMRSVTERHLAMSDDVRKHLELCLDCRACETACPSGVKYGQMIEPYKIALHKQHPAGPLQTLILHHLFPYKTRVKAALFPVWVLQKLGIHQLIRKAGLTRLLPKFLRGMEAMLPALSSPFRVRPLVLPPIGPRRARVALFLGCVADAMYPNTNDATARVLQHNGCEVVIPRGQVCCGAIHYHSGAEEPALAMARHNMALFPPDQYDAIIINAAGCGAMLKDYAHILPAADRPQAEAFVAKVKDWSEFLWQLGPVQPHNAVPARVAYHDACHLCHAQQIRSQPRALLQMIPGLELLNINESEICCGAAGTYNLTQPDMSDRLGRRKLDNLLETGAEIAVTGNVGCLLQIDRHNRERSNRLQVLHPLDLLDRAYGGAPRNQPPTSDHGP